MLNDATLRNFEDRFQLVQSKAKDTVQSAHCAVGHHATAGLSPGVLTVLLVSILGKRKFWCVVQPACPRAIGHVDVSKTSNGMLTDITVSGPTYYLSGGSSSISTTTWRIRKNMNFYVGL